MKKGALAILFIYFVLSSNISFSQERSSEAVGSLAEQQITPFGGLEWDDTIIEVVNKINKIEGTESIIIGISNSKYNSSQKEEIKGKTEISDILGIIKKMDEAILVKENDRKLFNTKYMDKYIGNDGKEKMYFNDTNSIYIECFTVNIEGVRFVLNINFVSKPEIESIKPGQVIYDKVNKIYYPYVVGTVGVSAHPRGFELQEKYLKINKLVVDKYGKLGTNGKLEISDTGKVPIDEKFHAADSSGNELDVHRVSGSFYRISYASKYFIDKLNNQRNDEKKKLEVKDMGSGL